MNKKSNLDFSGRIRNFGYEPIQQDEELYPPLTEYTQVYSPLQRDNIESQSQEISFVKVFLFLIFITFVIFGSFVLYLLYDGKLQSNFEVDQPITINPDFNHTTTNNFENSYNPTNNFNNSFTFNLDEEFLNKICNITDSA